MSERAEADRDLNNDRNLNSYNNAATGAGSRRFELPDGNQTGRGGGVVGGIRRIFLCIESFWPTANAFLRKVEIHVVASFSFMEITSIIIYTHKKRIISFWKTEKGLQDVKSQSKHHKIKHHHTHHLLCFFFHLRIWFCLSLEPFAWLLFHGDRVSKIIIRPFNIMGWGIKVEVFTGHVNKVFKRFDDIWLDLEKNKKC